MVDLLGALNFSASGLNHSLVSGLYIILMLLVVGGLLFFAFYWTRFKIVFIIRKVAGNRTITFMDKARIIRKTGHPIRWKLRKLKTFVPVPPKEALDVTTKGKEFVECYLTEDGEYHYIEDCLNAKGSSLGSLNPVKAVDKEFYAQQVEEANKYKKKSLSDVLLQIAPIMAIVIILVLFMVFFDKAVAPTMELSQSLISASQSLSSAVTSLNTCSQAMVIV